jgi:hypothetical protein
MPSALAPGCCLGSFILFQTLTMLITTNIHDNVLNRAILLTACSVLLWCHWFQLFVALKYCHDSPSKHANHPHYNAHK